MAEIDKTKDFGEYFEFGTGVTWKQFKDAIDKLLADNDMPQDVPIWYIDISFPGSFGAGCKDGSLSVQN